MPLRCVAPEGQICAIDQFEQRRRLVDDAMGVLASAQLPPPPSPAVHACAANWLSTWVAKR